MEIEVVKAVSIEKLESPIKVYNLEVEDNHNYYVSNDEVLVHNNCGDTKGSRENSNSFEIEDWSGYPDGPRPEGPFTVLEGKEYYAARKAANNANSQIHRNDPSLKGKQIHEIKPVKFGGDPVNPENKIPLTPKEHAQYTRWWNNLLRNLKK